MAEEPRPVSDPLRELVVSLQKHGRCSPGYFAELVFAAAFSTELEEPFNPGYDIRTREHGRVQVKCRRLPADGRREERLHLRDMEPGSFDYLGAVIFNNDWTVKSGALIPANVVWQLIHLHDYNQGKIPYIEVRSLPGAVDVADRLRQVFLRAQSGR